MNTHEGKSSDNKSKAAANNLTPKPEGILSAVDFADNRPVTLVQKKLQENVNDGAALKQLKAKKETVQKKKNNTGLPGELKSGIENLSGISMDDVKVHYNSSQPSQLNALAYAQGTAIHIAPGQEKHLPHEAWHVVQQAQGRVEPTTQLKDGVAINDNLALEHEADVMGNKALQLKSELVSGNEHGVSMRKMPVQRKVVQRVGEVPGLYHDHLKTLMMDGKRIEARVPSLRDARADAVMMTYIPAATWGILDAQLLIKSNVVEHWKIPESMTAPGWGARLHQDEVAMDYAFRTINDIHLRYGDTNKINVSLEAVRADGRIVPGQGLWHHLKALPAFANVTQPLLNAFITAQIADWATPSLRLWYTALGLPPAGGGHIRIVQLPACSGRPVHLSLYMANVDNTVAITAAIGTIMDTLIPDSVVWLGTHVTLELFGAIDGRNPHYYKGQGFRIPPVTDAQTRAEMGVRGIDEATLSGELQTRLNDRRTIFQQNAVAFAAERRAGYV